MPDILTDLEVQRHQDEQVRLAAELAETKREAARQRDLNRRHAAELEELRKKLDLVTAIDAARLAAPKWLVPARKPKGHHGTACFLLTDTHFGEVVNPLEVEGLNAFNDEIADFRIRRFADKAVTFPREYVSGVTYDGCVLFVGGDIFTGTIHDELLETNSETVYASVIRWIEPLGATIALLADAYDRVHVVVTYGNHGRRTRKPRAKQRAQDNIEWLFYKVLERETRADKRITWQVPDSADTRVTVGSTRYVLTHGDQFRGGSGISGFATPLALGSYRKTRRSVSAGAPYDVLVMGHWHQHRIENGIIVGGTLKGYDEYAYVSNFGYEPPTQAFWINTPERGVMFPERLYVMDREAEGW